MNDSDCIPLYLFAKAPLPGRVKTRMQPQLSEAQSAQLATLMLKQTVEKVSRFWPGKLILTVSPSINHALFDQLAHHYNLPLEAQVDGDLGSKMLHVLGQGIEQFGSAVVMGCDVPQITNKILLQVHARLVEKQPIIGPASDGGFYLLGLNRMVPGIFAGVDWGSRQVIARVCQNFQHLGMALSHCSELRDIDNWDDLCWLGTHDQHYREFVA